MKKLLSILLILPLFILLCSCSTESDKSGSSSNTNKTDSKIVGTWDNVYEIDESQYQNTDDTTVKVKSVTTTYIFGDDGTYSEVISNIIDENGTESSTNISETSGTYTASADSIRLAPEVVNGLSKTDFIESSQNSLASYSDVTINDPTYGFKPFDLTVTFDGDDTMTLQGLPGGDLTFNRVKE